MPQGISVKGIPARRRTGIRMVVAVVLGLLIVAVVVWLLRFGRLNPTGQQSRKPPEVENILPATWAKAMTNGEGRSLPVDTEGQKHRAELTRALADQQALTKKVLEDHRKMQEEIDKLKQRRPGQGTAEKSSEKPPKPEPKKRAKPIYLTNEHLTAAPTSPLYTLPVWTYIPCVLENVLVSEIPGHFTVRTRRPVMDTSGSVVLIPQHARIGAQSDSGELLLGNERIPTFALSLQQSDGAALDLGRSPIMDAAGTNGLSDLVDNHTWRLIWTSVFIGGLQGGQQVLQSEMGTAGMAPIAAGIAREGSKASQQRLGRAQDTRPTLTVRAGDECQILTTKAMQLPKVL